MSRFPKLQAFLQLQFNSQKMSNQIRTLPSEYTDKNTGEVRTNKVPSKSMNIPEKLVPVLEQAIEVHRENKDYLEIKDGTNLLNAIKVIEPRTVPLTDRNTGELIEKEYPASLILAPQVESWKDPEITEEFMDTVLNEIGVTETKSEAENY